MLEPNFFGQGSPYLNHPLLTLERTAAEIDFVLNQVQPVPGARFLDVGCGPGRHSLELARRGYQVLGIDPSPEMVASAQQAAEQAKAVPSPVFIQARGEEFITQQPFDAAICLFTTLGQMDSAGDNASLIRGVYQALMPAGFFIVEVPNRDYVLSNLKHTERFGDSENYTEVERQIDLQSNAVTEIFSVVSPQETCQYILRYRIYSPVDLRALLRVAGFEVLALFGNYNQAILRPGSPIILVVARKQ